MAQVPYTNDTDKHIHIGPVTIPPNETRHVEESHIPGWKKEETAAPAAKADPLAEFLNRKVPDVVAALAGLSLAEVERLGELEQLGQQRKGVLNAIAETLLVRASQAEALKNIGTLSDEALAAEMEQAKTDISINPAYLAALEAETALRAQDKAAV